MEINLNPKHLIVIIKIKVFVKENQGKNVDFIIIIIIVQIIYYFCQTIPGADAWILFFIIPIIHIC
jgi:hypothetical protein